MKSRIWVVFLYVFVVFLLGAGSGWEKAAHASSQESEITSGNTALNNYIEPYGFFNSPPSWSEECNRPNPMACLPAVIEFADLPVEWRPSVINAASKWSNIGTKFRFVQDQDIAPFRTVLAWDHDENWLGFYIAPGEVRIVKASQIPARSRLLLDGAPAITWPYPERKGSTITFGAVLVINDVYSFSTDGTPNSNEYDLESILVHELGHVVGLGHNLFEVSSVMWPFGLTGQVRRELSESDKDKVISLYGPISPLAFPPRPALIYPGHGQVITDDTPLLDWSASQSADLYMVQLASDPRFIENVRYFHTTNSEFQLNNPITKKESVYWRVKATTSGFNSHWSESGVFVVDDPIGNPVNDTIKPTATNFTAIISNRFAALTSSNVQDNPGGSGVREVRYSAKWENTWHDIGVVTNSPYSLNWDTCAAGVPDGLIVFGMEIWDNAGNKWVWSNEGHVNPTSTKSYDCSGAPTEEGVYLYQSTGATGSNFCRITVDTPNIETACGGGWNDEIRSVRMVGDWSAVLFFDDIYRGSSIILDRTDNDLGDNGIGSNTSSLRVRRRNPAIFSLFELGDYNGNFFTSDRTIRDLSHWNFNDTAESIQVASGYEVILCVDENFHGACGRTTQNNTDIAAVNPELHPSIDVARLSSVRVCQGTCPPTPNAPEIISPQHSTESDPNSDVVFRWSGNGTQYRVSYRLQGGPSTTTGWFSGTQWSPGRLTESNTPYYWRVQSWNEFGEGGWSTETPFYVRNTKAYMSPVNNPEELGDFTLFWSPLSWATDYELQEALSVSLTSDEISVYGGSQRVGQVTTYQRTNTTWATGKYCHRVRGLSDSVTGLWSDFRCTIARVRYSPPDLAFIANYDGNGDYSVNWSTNDSTINYELEETYNGNTQVYTLTTKTYSFSGKSNGTWCYRVRGFDHENYVSRWSNTECVVVSGLATPVITEINNYDYDDTFEIAWNVIDGATSYELQERIGDGDWITIGGGTERYFIKVNASPGELCYRVRASRYGTAGGWSDEECTAVLFPPPVLYDIDNDSGSSDFYVYWEAVGGANGYELEEKLNSGTYQKIYNGPNLFKFRTGQANGQWCYRVKAHYEVPNTYIGSLYYSVEKCTTVGLTAPTISAINNDDGDGNFSINWSSVAAATYYELQEQFNHETWNLVQSSTSTSKDFNDKGTGTWCYRVRSLNSGSISEWGQSQCTVHWAITGALTLDSRSTTGMQGSAFADSGQPALSSDGRYVAFRSLASLVSEDTNGQYDIFVRDRQTATTSRVSVSSSGAQANASSLYLDISANGQYVAFTSEATNLVEGDSNARQDVFVHDRQTGATTRVSVSSSGIQANESSWSPTISANGRFVAYYTIASNLVPGDSNSSEDVFVHDRQLGTTTRVSVTSSGVQANSNAFAANISGDGRYVAFLSNASNLVTGDTNGTTDVFVHDSWTQQTTRVSVSSSGTQANGNSEIAPELSADGRYVVFGSWASNLVANDTNNAKDVFVHDRQTGITSRVSISIYGAEGNLSTGLQDSPDISADGRYVVFSSNATNMIPDDSNGRTDIFLLDRQTGQLLGISRQPTQGSLGNDKSEFAAISGDGTTIAFESSATNLVSNDTNLTRDVFLFRRPNIPVLAAIDNPQSSNGYMVSWTSVGSAAGYELFEKLNEGSWTRVYIGTGTSNSFSAKAAGRWCYQVRAISNMNWGPMSGQACTTVAEPDSIDPTLTWLEPVGDNETFNVNGQSINLVVSASDNIGVTEVIFTRYDAVNGQWITIGEDIDSPYAVSLDTSTLNPGWNQVNAEAYDAAGNSNWKYIGLDVDDNQTISISLTPVADAYTSSANPTTKYGSATTLRVKEAAADLYSFLKFDTSVLACAQVESATLRLYVTDASTNAGSIYAVDSNWAEGTITWNNDPVIGGSPLDSPGAAALNTWVEFDVTAGLNPGGESSFGIMGNVSDVVYYNSRESARDPELVIEYTELPGTAPTADFSATPITGNAPLAVTFSNYSTGCPTLYVWDFGDGATSNAANPSHTYTVPGTYAVSLTAANADGDDIETKTAYVTVTTPPPGINTFYISPAASKTIGGIPAAPADILRYTKSTNTWTMVYDGSDHGTPKNVSAFHLMDDGSLLLVFGVDQPLTINGAAATAKPYDIVKFTPNNPNIFPLGVGTYSWFFQGKPNQLSTTGEKIDAMDLAGNRLLLSTTGVAKVTRPNGTILTADDEDVFVYDLATNQWESSLLIDGSLIPAMAGEDIGSIWDDPDTGDYYITITGSFTVAGVKGNGKSIVKLTPNGGATVFTPSLVPWLAPGATFPTTLDGLEAGN